MLEIPESAALFDVFPDARGVRRYPMPWVLRDSVQAFYQNRAFATEAIGLENLWTGSLCLNPPYGPQVREWIAKAVKEYEAGRVAEALILLKASTDARWFESLAAAGAAFCFIRGRLRFDESGRDAPFASMIAYLGPRRADFAREFGPCGSILHTYSNSQDRPGRIRRWLRLIRFIRWE